MMTEKQLFLVIAIVCLVLFIVYKIIYNIEGFVDTLAPTNMPIDTSTSTITSTPITTPTSTLTPSNQDIIELCPTLAPKPWWETESPKQIVSYVTGVRFPVHAIKPSEAINSAFQIPYIKSGETESSGCIVIENAGTFTTRMCNADSIEQRWKIQKINDSKMYLDLLSKGSQYYSSRTTVDLPQGVQYGFFMVISEKDPSMVLASNGGNLTVQRIGNYTSQLWDITKDVGNANISIYDIPPETALSQNFTDPRTVGGIGAGAAYQYPGISGNNTVTSGGLNNGTPTLGPGGINYSSRNKQGSSPYNINVNFDSQSLMKLFGDISTTGPGLGLNDVTSATSSPPEGFNPNPESNSSCPACPSILTDYISKKDIPCLGCKL